MPRGALVALLALMLAAHAGAEDLSKVYKATLDWEEGAPAREWTCEDADVWHLDSFRYAYEGLEIEFGPSDVVFGKCGTNVVWATVLPAQPAKLKAPQQGNGERVNCLFLRFNPALVGKLFPTKTVKGHGPPSARLWACAPSTARSTARGRRTTSP